ncbi:hypothetical protein GHI93_00295 [Lactococcus hircilactis]|uniref:Uncharacterized protein n=1 Tax=Lactococcus hircilactis TaxID=1494462 RepID=A0A7X1Z6D1_9LACT|nr:hypothetical protein [Lactococcus hircilactis]MQW38390.1 hypothetical protein [Lactococcus hircilactis]
MIKIYRKDNETSKSFQQVVRWMKEHQLEFEINHLSELSKTEFVQMLRLSDGFSDLIITRYETGKA